jgi:hypothetical protein
MPSSPLDSRTQVARDSHPKPLPSLVERAALGSKDDWTSQELTSQELTSQELTTQELTTQELTPQELTPQELTPQELTPQELTPKELTTQQLVWWVSTPGPLVGEPLKKRHPSERLD